MAIHERTATRAALPSLPSLDTVLLRLRVDEYGRETLDDNGRPTIDESDYRAVEIERRDAYPIAYRAALLDRAAAQLPLDATDDEIEQAATVLAVLLSGDRDLLAECADALDALGMVNADALRSFAPPSFDPLDDDGSAAAPYTVGTRRVDAASRYTRRVIGSSAPYTADRATLDAGFMSATVVEIDDLTRWYYAGAIPEMIGTDARAWEQIVEIAAPDRLRSNMGASIVGSLDARKPRAYRSTIVSRPRSLASATIERDGTTYLPSAVRVMRPHGPRETVTFTYDGTRWIRSTIEPRPRRKPRGTGRAYARPTAVESVPALDLDAMLDARRSTPRSTIVRMGDAIRSAGSPAPTRAVRVVEQTALDVTRAAFTDGRVTVSVVDLPAADRWRVFITVRDEQGAVQARTTRSNVRRGGLSRALAHYLARV